MNRDRAASLAFLAVGIYGIIFSMNLNMGTLKQPGARMFPICISFLLCFSGILGFIRATRKRGILEKEEGIDWRQSVKKLNRPLQIVGITLAYILIMEKIGYLIATWLYLFVLFSWVCRYSFWVAAILSVLIGAASWYFFGRILAVQLPEGILSF